MCEHLVNLRRKKKPKLFLTSFIEYMYKMEQKCKRGVSEVVVSVVVVKGNKSLVYFIP